MRAGELLKELMQVGTQEEFQRLKFGVRDAQIAIHIDELERKQVSSCRAVLRLFSHLATWLGHASHLSGRIILWMCKRVTFLTSVLRAATALQGHLRCFQYPPIQ